MEGALTLVGAYQGAWLAATGKKHASCWRPVQRLKQYPKILAAVKLAVSHRIDPVLWVLWSFETWANQHDGLTKTPPSLSYVFAAKRLEEQHTWFEAWFKRKPDYGRRTIGPAQNKLMIAIQFARHACALGDRDALDAVLDEGPLETLIQNAKREVDALKIELAEKIAAGVWVW